MTNINGYDKNSQRIGAEVITADVEKVISPTKPLYNITVSRDAMEAYLEITQSSENTLPPQLDDILVAIKKAKIKYGIDNEALQKLCISPRYEHSHLIASGTAAIDGCDGFLKHTVTTQTDLKPKERADGTVDYRDLGFVQNVNKGQILCEIHLPQPGVNGTDLYGNVLRAFSGRAADSPAGRNTVLNDEGTALLAACDGNVSVSRNVVSVSPELKINGNIDNSTGDIDFVGDVFIKGDIVSGFKVKAKGNIIVRGNVEGAVLESGGDISIGEGVNGMEQGKIIAKGSVKCKYIQSCYIKTGKNIYSDTIMYCTIDCGGDLELAGKRGRLISGRTTVAGSIEAITIGTDSHVPTIVTINSLASIEKEIQDLQRQNKSLEAEQLKLNQLNARLTDLKEKNRLPEDMLPVLNSLGENQRVLTDNMTLVNKELEEKLKEQTRRQTEDYNSYIYCAGKVHTGVTVQFGNIITPIKQSVLNTRIVLLDGEIKFLLG